MDATIPASVKKNKAGRRSGGARAKKDRPPVVGRLLDVQGAAAYLGCPVETFRGWCRDTNLKLPKVQLGRRLYFRREHLDALIEDNTRLKTA